MSPAAENPLPALEALYRSHFRQDPRRASVSFLGVDSIEVLQFAVTPAPAYLTLGMSHTLMAEMEEDDTRAPLAVFAPDPTLARRAELLLSAAGSPEELWRKLAVLAAAPAVQSTIYRPGDRVDLGQAWCAGSRCTGAILQTSALPSVQVQGAPAVEVLEVLPATAQELAWARIHGSDALIQLWHRSDTILHDLARQSATLV